MTSLTSGGLLDILVTFNIISLKEIHRIPVLPLRSSPPVNEKFF